MTWKGEARRSPTGAGTCDDSPQFNGAEGVWNRAAGASSRRRRRCWRWLDGGHRGRVGSFRGSQRNFPEASVRGTGMRSNRKIPGTVRATGRRAGVWKPACGTDDRTTDRSVPTATVRRAPGQPDAARSSSFSYRGGVSRLLTRGRADWQNVNSAGHRTAPPARRAFFLIVTPDGRERAFPEEPGKRKLKPVPAQAMVLLLLWLQTNYSARLRLSSSQVRPPEDRQAPTRSQNQLSTACQTGS